MWSRSSAVRAGLVMAVAAVAVLAAPATQAGAQTLAAPEDVSAEARSLGLAVDVSWTAVSGADDYEVLRSEDDSTPSEYLHLAATTSDTQATDLGYTVGDTWYYQVRAVAADGSEGALSPPVAVTTSSELLPGLNSAFAWIRGQQEAAQGFRVTFHEQYDDAYRGRLAGNVDGVEDLAGERELLPFVAFSSVYAGDYVGPVSGVWRHVAEPSDYRVDVYSVSDAAYLQGSFPLRADGAWDSGEAIARGGEKVAVLVRRSDDLVVATSGQPETRLRDVAIQVFSRTDADYLQEEVSLASDGSFRTMVAVAPGTKIARLVNTRTGRIINSTEWADAQSYQGLVRSFSIPQDDPDYGYSTGGARSGYRLEQRSFIYDDALAVLAMLREGQTARAEAVLTQLAALQNPDGSLDFSYDSFLGRVADHYRRTGATAWVGYAAVQYARETNDTRFDAFTERLADHLLALQVTEANGFLSGDPRLGSVLGGRGRYAADGSYTYEDVAIEWASTEHNIDAYFFLRDLANDTGDDGYERASEAIRNSLLTNHWQASESRFYQGVAPGGPDAGRALDLVSWGGLFLLAVGEESKARAAASQLEEFRVAGLAVAMSLDPSSYNATYSAAGPIDGYKPYADSPGYDEPPAVAWSEGTWGPAAAPATGRGHHPGPALDGTPPGRRSAGWHAPGDARRT